MTGQLSIRAKLALWYLAVTSTALLLFGLLSYGTLRFTLLQLKEASLIRREQRLNLYLEQNRESGTRTSIPEQLRSYSVIAHEGNLFQIRDLNGSLAFPLDQETAELLPHPPSDCRKPVFRDTDIDGNPAMILCHQATLDGHPVRLYIGGSLEEDEALLNRYRNALMLLLPCLLGFAGVSGYLLSKHAMRNVDRMTNAAIEIGIGNLSSRLPVPMARDELRSLAIAWNQLLDRLEGAVSRLSEFSADASHDLRTSITVILATAQLSLHRHRSEEEHREDLDRIVGECRTASTLLYALLSLARSDNFVHEVAFQRINIGELVISGCRRVEHLAESSGIILDWHLPPDNLFVEGEEVLLQRLLGILLDNAIKYTPKDGEITVEVCAMESGVLLTVRDTGIGMSEEIRGHIFDRFYQADLRERKDRAGSGLGLSIARWIAEAHRVALTVESTPLKGSNFKLLFPAVFTTQLAGRMRSEYTMSPK